MITAVDTNVLLDILIPDAPQLERSRASLETAGDEGALLICEAVYAELAARFDAQDELDAFLADAGLELRPSTRDALHLAGQTWRTYAANRPRGLTCQSCGASQSVRCATCGTAVQARQHVLADFQIGAHASVQADRLLTRDLGYYATYFPRLALI